MGIEPNNETESPGRNELTLGGTSFIAPPKSQAVASMACVSLAMFLGGMSQTVVATTLPLIVADLGGFDRYTWVATSYLLAATLTFPIVGRLSDIYGRRLFLLLGLVIFTIASFLFGFCDTMNQVVACRAVQGLGGGAVMTCCQIAIADLFPSQDRGRFHGLLSGVYGMSFVAGPILGGFLADSLSWKWAFVWIGFGGIPILLVTALVFPKPRVAPVERTLDVVGMIVLAVAVPPLFVALSSGGVRHDWDSPFIVFMLLFSLAMIGLFISIEARAESPIVPLSLYADSTVGVAAITILLVGFGLYGSVLFLPLVFQVAFGFSATQSGGLLIPMLLGVAFGGVVAGSALSRTSGFYRSQALACAVLMTAGLFLLSTPRAMTNVVWSQVYVVVAALGMGGIFATVTVGVQNHVPFGVVGVVTSALQFSRSVGGMIGLSALGVVFATRFSSSLEQVVSDRAKALLADGQFQDLQKDPQALVDSVAAERLRSDLEAASPDGAVVTQQLLDSLGIALLSALETVFAVTAIAAALVLGFVMFFRVRVREETASDGTDEVDVT